MTAVSKVFRTKITKDLKEGLLEGAIRHGYDGAGLDGLVGYCQHLAERYPKTYGYLLGKLLPYNLNANVASAAVSEVRILSVPADHYLSRADIERMQSSPATLEVQPIEQPEPVMQAEPVRLEAATAAIVDEPEPAPAPVPAPMSERDLLVRRARAQGWEPLPPRDRRDDY
jgi:hypothetical protein